MTQANGRLLTHAETTTSNKANGGSGELQALLNRPLGTIAMQDGQMVPTDFEGVERISKWLFAEGVCPESVKSVGQCMAIIGYGMAIGLTALASLRSVMLVRGVPTVWGDAALALVRKSPLCVGVREFFEVDTDPEKMRAVCEVKRATKLPDGNFREEVVTYSFSVADAKKAGLWGKAGPWSQHPKRMLKYRARAFCLRDAFPDVLGGLYITEEFEDGGNDDRTSALDARVSSLTIDAGAGIPSPTEENPASVDTTPPADPPKEPAPAKTATRKNAKPAPDADPDRFVQSLGLTE